MNPWDFEIEKLLGFAGGNVAPEFDADEPFDELSHLSAEDRASPEKILQRGYRWGYDTDNLTGITHIMLEHYGRTVAWLKVRANDPRFATDEAKLRAVAARFFSHVRFHEEAVQWCRREEARAGAVRARERAMRPVIAVRSIRARSRSRRRHRHTRRVAASSGSSDGPSDPPRRSRPYVRRCDPHARCAP